MPIICLEGPDCTGKSTVAAAIIEWLQITSRQAILANNPGSTPLGKTIRKLIKQPETFSDDIQIDPRTERLLFLCDNSVFVETILKKNLDKWIIMDRCNFISDIVYGESLGVDLTTIQKMHACIESPPLIDMLFVFKCCDEVLEIRRKARNERCRIERYGDDYLKRVNKSYSTILETHGYYLKNFVKSKQVNGICGSPARTILHAEYVDVSMPVGEVVRTIIEKIKINQGI